MDSFLYFFKQGFFHILDWQAYDHILFLIVLTVVCTFNNWKRTIWLVTLFTLAQILMLLLTTYNIVNVNSRLATFLIPFTILIIAIFNVFTAGKVSKSRNDTLYFIFSFFFGLIHGLGFSSTFKRIVGDNNTLISLLEFSLGIEVSQMLVVIIILFLGYVFQTIFRFSKRDWTLVTSSIVIGLVIPMLIANKIL